MNAMARSAHTLGQNISVSVCAISHSISFYSAPWNGSHGLVRDSDEWCLPGDRSPAGDSPEPPSFYGTYSLNRIKATLIYRRTGNFRAVQLLPGHRKIESAVRYLGIEVDGALAIAEQVNV